MLFLVGAYRHIVGIINEYIRRHKHRIVKKTYANVAAELCAFVFKLRHSCRLAELRVAVKNPAELSVRGNMALNKNNILFGVNAES